MQNVEATAAEYGEICAQTYTTRYGDAGRDAIVVVPRIDGVEVGTRLPATWLRRHETNTSNKANNNTILFIYAIDK